MRNVLDKSYRDNQNSHFMFFNFFFGKSCSLWDNVEKYDAAREYTNDATVWRIRVSCWIRKATYTHAHAHADLPGHRHTRALTHTHKYVILLFHSNNNSWTRLNITLYVHCQSCLRSYTPTTFLHKSIAPPLCYTLDFMSLKSCFRLLNSVWWNFRTLVLFLRKMYY